MSQYSSCNMQDNTRSSYTQYPTPDSTQTQTNNSPRSLQNSQSNTTQFIDSSFLSDAPQSEYSTLDNSLMISTVTQESPHTPESLLYSPAPDTSPGDEHTELNPRKQREQQPTLRRSPRITSNQTPQSSEQHSDSTSLKSQDSLNNRELINKPAALALEVLNESTELNLFNILSEQEASNNRMELRDLLATSNMIIDSVNHNSSQRSQEVGDEMNDVEYTTNKQKETTGQPRKVFLSGREHDNENGYPQSVNLVIANEISNTLLRQSEHYNNMASKISNLKFIKVNPESEEEEQFTTPGIRRSMRKRTTANYSYPRYSYGGSSSSKRSKTRKRSRSFRKESLSTIENEADVNSGVVHVDNEVNEVHEPPPVQSDNDEANDDHHDIQGANDSWNVDENIPDNMYLKHDLRSRKILLELPEEIIVEDEETEEEPVVVASTKKTTRSRKPAKKPVKRPVRKSIRKSIRKSVRKSVKKPVKKPILEVTFNKSAKSIPRRKISRKLTPRKKNDDHEWHPDGADSDSGNDSEAIVATPRNRRATSRAIAKENVENIDTIPEASITKRSLSKKAAPNTSTTPEISTRKRSSTRKVPSIDTTPEVNITKRSPSKKAAPKTSKVPKITREGKRSAQSIRGRGRGRGRTSRLRNYDTEYIYSEEGETESETEIIPEVETGIDAVNDNSENQIAQGLSDAEMDNVFQDEIEHNVSVSKEQVSTPVRPKRTRKNTKSSISEPVVSTPRSTRSSRSTKGREGSRRSVREDVNMQDDFMGNIHEPSDKEEDDNVQLVPTAQPKKRSVRNKGRGGKVRGRGGRVGGNTASDQPPDPNSDPDLVEISAGNRVALVNAVRALAGQNYDIVHSDIEEARAPVFVKPHNPATRSTSISSTPPPELQSTPKKSGSNSTSNLLNWSNDHWRHLRVFYEETKSEYIRSGKVVNGNEDVYKEVTKKFFEVDVNYRTFGEENLRMRIIALESADFEKSIESPGNIQRRSSIESSSSRGSRSSVSRYNKAYLNLRKDNRAKRKRSESNATTFSEGKNSEIEDKVSKRPRVEENTASTSGPGTTTPDNTHQNNSMFSKLFGNWFGSNQSQSYNEEAPGELANAGEEEPINSTPTSRSWW